MDTASADGAKATAGIKPQKPTGINASSNGSYFEEFADVFKQHFKLKQQVIQKHLFQWLQEDKSLEPLYAEYWNVWDQLREQEQLATGGCASKRMGGAEKRAAHERVKVDPPAVKMKDGVILLDDDDDQDQLNADIALAMKMSVTQTIGAAASANGGSTIIELADSDDDAKPAAVKLLGASKERIVPREKKQDSGQNSTEERPSVVAAALSPDVVDLT